MEGGTVEDVFVWVTPRLQDGGAWTFDAEILSYQVDFDGVVIMRIERRPQEGRPMSDAQRGAFKDVWIWITPRLQDGGAWTIDAETINYEVDEEDAVVLKVYRRRTPNMRTIVFPDMSAPPPPDVSRGSKKRSRSIGRCEESVAFKAENGHTRASASRCIDHDGGGRCDVEDCTALGPTPIFSKDQHGAPGRRCEKHGPRCDFEGCNSVGRFTLTPKGATIAGWRCGNHVEQCNVKGCTLYAMVQSSASDSLGEEGWRCGTHAMHCNVGECTNAPTWWAGTDCDSGPRGPRCSEHISRCTVKGCENSPLWATFEDDELGFAGPRCDEHHPSCSIRGCKNSTEAKTMQSDEHGEAGFRCKEHRPRCGFPSCKKFAIVRSMFSVSFLLKKAE